MSAGGASDVGAKVAVAETREARRVSTQGCGVLAAFRGGAENYVSRAERAGMECAHVLATC